jgi:uncharacterized protein YegL
MKQNYTHLIIVLDESGSMQSLTKATVEGVNALVVNQTAQPGALSTALYTFNQLVKEVTNFTVLTDANYIPRGSTALFDAVCTAIDNEGKTLAAKSEDERPDKVVVVVVTDGEENASTSFTLDHVKSRVDLQRDAYKWEFVFLGANIDAFAAGKTYGFNKQSTYQFTPDANSIHVMYASVNASLSSYRSGVTNSVDMTPPTA